MSVSGIAKPKILCILCLFQVVMPEEKGLVLPVVTILHDCIPVADDNKHGLV